MNGTTFSVIRSVENLTQDEKASVLRNVDRGWVFLELPDGYLVQRFRPSKDHEVLIIEIVPTKGKAGPTVHRIRNTAGIHRLRSIH